MPTKLRKPYASQHCVQLLVWVSLVSLVALPYSTQLIRTRQLLMSRDVRYRQCLIHFHYQIVWSLFMLCVAYQNWLPVILKYNSKTKHSQRSMKYGGPFPKHEFRSLIRLRINPFLRAGARSTACCCEVPLWFLTVIASNVHGEWRDLTLNQTVAFMQLLRQCSAMCSFNARPAVPPDPQTQIFR
jgi:hypothetical protein